MKKLVLLIFCLSILIPAQFSRGIVKENLSVKSEIMGKSVNYCIYLPFDYNSSERNYPVVYLLHGYTDDHTAWLQFGEINILADKAIAEGEIPSMIIVTPDAEVSWYMNNFDKSVSYEDFFIKELIPHIDSKFRTKPKKQYRAVSGLSMGGYGSLLYSIKHPELFSSCSALSAAVFTKDQTISFSEKRWERVDAVLYGKNLKGENRITTHWKENNPIDIINKSEDHESKSVRFYFDCGDDDYLLTGNLALYQIMKNKDFNCELRVRDGIHNWDYWRTGVLNGLKFIAKSFHQ